MVSSDPADGDVSTGYQLELNLEPVNIDGAGNSFSEARDIGLLDLNPIPQTFTDEVSGADQEDFYSFELQAKSQVEINLGELSANANLFLADASEELIEKSNNAGTASELISGTLNPGTYFVQVRSDHGDGNPAPNYKLTLSAEFVVNDVLVSELGVQLIDPEFDSLGNRITWQDTNGSHLWVAPIDPETGDLLLEEKVLLDTGLAPNNFPVNGVDATGNGPEWVSTSDGAEIVYTKLIDGDYYLGHAWWTGNEWETEILPDSPGGHAPVATLNPEDENPLIRYFVGTTTESRQFVVWQELNNSEQKGLVPGTSEGAAQSSRWVEGEESLISIATVDGVKQVFKYDVRTDNLTQLTFSPTSKETSFMWHAPEFNNEHVFIASARDTSVSAPQVEIYRNINGEWTQINTILMPSELGSIRSPEPFVYNGRSYISLVAKNDQEGTSDIWMFGINPDFEFSRQLNDPSVIGIEPEFFRTEAGAFIYYNDQPNKTTRRADTGLGLPDGAGNNLEEARDLGIFGVEPISQLFTDEVGVSITLFDKEDYYRFELEASSTVELALDALSANANLLLLDENSNIIAESENTGTTPEFISETLDSGSYFVLALSNQADGDPATGYQLELNVEPVNIDGTGNSLEEAYFVGILDATPIAQTFSDWVGVAAPEDVIIHTPPEKLLNLLFSR